jgi:hypothetical protein
VITTSASATTRSKISGSHGMAAFADSPRGPFLSTTVSVAPARAASDSASRVITNAAFGLPLSSTATRSPDSEAGDGASAAGAWPMSPSGR